MNEMPNKSLHRTAIPLRSIAAGQLGRSRRAARARTASCAERLARFVRPRADSRGRTKSFEPLEF